MVSTMPTERVVSSNSPPRPRSNLSFFLNKPHDVKFAQVPIPQLPTPNHVVVAINYTGICGSDIHYWDHGRIGQFVLQEPMILGHESSGTVVEVGDSVTSLKTGDRVAIEPGYPCRYCHNCLAGRYNLCDKMAFAATPPHHGTLTGFWVAPFDFCYKLPQTVSLQEGALIEPLAVSVHIIRQAQVTPGNSVVIMGTGPIGLLCGAVSKAFGARKIIGVDIVQSKLKFAEGLGFTHTYLSKRISAEDNAMAILDSGDLGQGADVVIDASGAETSIQTSLHVVKAGGVYVQGGMGKADITFPIMAMCQKEVTVKGSFRYGPGDYELAIELVSSNRVPVNKLISDVVDFCQAEEAFKKAKEGQFVKVLIAGPNEPKQAKGLDSLSQESIYA